MGSALHRESGRYVIRCCEQAALVYQLHSFCVDRERIGSRVLRQLLRFEFGELSLQIRLSFVVLHWNIMIQYKISCKVDGFFVLTLLQGLHIVRYSSTIFVPTLDIFKILWC